MNSDPKTICKHIKLVGLDVDGVLTDGQIIHGSGGMEIKAFNVKDGAGIKLLQKSGIKIAIITARSSEAVTHRAKELGIELLFQGVKNKLQKLTELTASLNITLDNVAYMGDDFPDLAIIQSVGLGTCPADAAGIVQEHSQWRSTAPGGRGAVRELAEFILTQQGCLDDLLSDYKA